MKIATFEDIIAWQKAKDQTLLIYQIFGPIRDFGFRDQIQRATVSVMNNIAEGFERHSDSEFRQSLYVAKGSCAEVRSMLYLAIELTMIDEEQFRRLKHLNVEICKIISGLISSLN
jgi:four helix bundle protein